MVLILTLNDNSEYQEVGGYRHARYILDLKHAHADLENFPDLMWLFRQSSQYSETTISLSMWPGKRYSRLYIFQREGMQGNTPSIWRGLNGTPYWSTGPRYSLGRHEAPKTPTDDWGAIIHMLTVPGLDEIEVRAECGVGECCERLEPPQDVDGIGGEWEALIVAIVRTVLPYTECVRTQERRPQRGAHPPSL